MNRNKFCLVCEATSDLTLSEHISKEAYAQTQSRMCKGFSNEINLFL